MQWRTLGKKCSEIHITDFIKINNSRRNGRRQSGVDEMGVDEMGNSRR